MPVSAQMGGLRRGPELGDRDGVHVGGPERHRELRVWRQGRNRRHLQRLILQHGAGGVLD